MIELRPYQKVLIDRTREAMRVAQRVLLVAPTGSGKTVMFAHIGASAARLGKRVLFLAHRRELVHQIRRAVDMAGGGDGLFVESVFSPSMPENIDLVVLDEAHHAAQNSTWWNMAMSYPSARVLGVTATPIRTDNRGLGNLFGAMVLGPSVAELTKDGFLSPYRMFTTSREHTQRREASIKPRVVGSAVGMYLRHAAGKRAVVFCSSVDFSRRVMAAFMDEGISASMVHGEMASKDRDIIVERFRDGKTQVLSSCDVIQEGFDLPAIEAVLLMRATKSLGLYLQQVGRALRPYPGKTEAIILDHAGNCHRHGFPDDDREWILSGDMTRPKRKRLVKMCERCFSAYRSHLEMCPYCGAINEKKPRKVVVVAGRLVEVTDKVKKEIRAERKKATTLSDLIALGVSRGYKNPQWWAHMVMNGRRNR